MSYVPYPSRGDSHWLPERQLESPSVIIAVRLMYVGAGLHLLGTIIQIALVHGEENTLLQTNQNYTPSELHAGVWVSYGLVAALGLVGAGLWVWMARRNADGRSWARIVAAVLFAIFTCLVALVGLLTGINGGDALAMLIWLVGLAATFFLWRPDASRFYQESRRYQ